MPAQWLASRVMKASGVRWKTLRFSRISLLRSPCDVLARAGHLVAALKGQSSQQSRRQLLAFAVAKSSGSASGSVPAYDASSAKFWTA